MDEPVFPDKSQPPTDADLTIVLGRAKRHWDNIRDHAQETNPDASPEWKFYTKKSGWSFLLRGKRRNVLYMLPTGKRCFTVAFLFNKKAVQAAEHAGLPDDVSEIVRNGPQYPEGRAVRLDVTKAADVKSAKKLLAIKMES